MITFFSGGKEGNHSPTDHEGEVGGLKKVMSQLTANERGS